VAEAALEFGAVVAAGSGQATVSIGAERHTVTAGDTVIVPANTTIEITNDASAPLLALCCLPVGGESRSPDGQIFTQPWTP